MPSSLPVPLCRLLKGDGVIWILTQRNVQALQGARREQKEFLGEGVSPTGLKLKPERTAFPVASKTGVSVSHYWRMINELTSCVPL